jgi:response regulator RpfG family c-di-GMP phosphodiesterase
MSAWTEDPDRSATTAELILRHSVASLDEVFSFISPAGVGRVQRICRLTESLATMSAVHRPEHLALLAFVSQLDWLTLPEAIVLKMHHGQLLTENERRLLRSTPTLAVNLLSRIPGLHADLEIVRLHDVHAVTDAATPLESSILRVAVAYDRLEAGGATPVAAVAAMRERHPMYDADVVDTLEEHLLTSIQDIERSVLTADLLPQMVVTRDVVGTDGVLRLGAGHELTPVIIERIRVLADRQLISEAMLVKGPQVVARSTR